MNNTQLLKVLPKLEGRENQLKAIGAIIGSKKFTYKQLWAIRDFVKNTYMRKELYIMLDDMMLLVHQGKTEEAFDMYNTYYQTYTF